MTRNATPEEEKLKSQAGTGNIDEKFAQQNEALKELIKELIKPISNLTYLVTVVLFVGFITVLFSSYALILDSNNSKTAAYEQLNSKIDLLLTKLK